MQVRNSVIVSPPLVHCFKWCRVILQFCYKGAREVMFLAEYVVRPASSFAGYQLL